MYLKSLEVQGYKSFANKVEFVFDEGVTAVVGPNGSGKSNVADAIRWVLGEQSYSNLRGKKTEDMIFSGSDGRARLGMASATLVLDNTDKWLPLDFSEVTIARRAYRSGENEYYLNGSRVRLKDVVELLGKGGLRRQTYTVIGQGMVDRVLSLHSDERRQLFEEAAGITFHRHKRATALSKLESTQANLLRLNDIAKEIEPRMKRLEKQAGRAEEYALVKTHLDGLLRVWYGYRWRQAQLQLRSATDRLQESDTLVAEERTRLGKLNRQVNTVRTELTESRSELSLWYAENNQLNKQAEAIQRELAVNEERARQFAAQRDELVEELAALGLNREATQRLIDRAQADLEQIEHALAEAKAEFQRVQAKLDAQEIEQEEIATHHRAAENQLRQAVHDLTERQARLTQLGERRTTLQVEEEERAAEIDSLLNQEKDLEERQSQLATRLSDLETTLLTLESEQNGKHDHLARLNETAEQLKHQLAELTRKDTSGYYSGLRAVLQPEAKLSGVVGTISQLIQAPPELEVGLEMALGGRLQDVVVESFADAESAITFLKETGKGRATFLPLDTIRPGRAIAVPDTPGVIGLASNLIQIEERLRPIAELTLNRTLFVEDLAAGRRAFSAMQGGFQIVTREGEVIRSGGAVAGGRSGRKKGEASMILAQEREWRDLPVQIEDMLKDHEEVSTRLAVHHGQAAEIKKQLKELEADYLEQDRQRQEIRDVANKAGHTLEQLRANISWRQDLQAKTVTELEQIADREAAINREIEALNQTRQDAEESALELAQEVRAQSSESLRAAESQAQSAVVSVEARHKNQQALLDSHKAALQQLSTQIESKRLRVETLSAQREALLKLQQELEGNTGQFETNLTGLAEKIAVREKQLAELEASQLQLEHEEQGLRQRLQRLEFEHNRASLEAARCQDELDNLQRYINEDLGMVQLEMSEEQVGQPLLPIRPIVTDLPAVKELPPGVDEDVKRLKVQLRRLGSINPDAPREYADLRERHEFLSHQTSDLEAAVADLREVIAKLDAAMEEAFASTFQQVATEFQRYFKTLFGGGEAQLLLTNPQNLINTGVEIVARPPGKRLQSLALLSGGERSLTAQALIFALLRISPTPFVVFDEVDAMLDEANVGRFREALSRLSQDIQFIIITHNRKTIESASTLYGVSMGSDSVSQVYSLKIDEWLADKAKAA
jgi:chromosome segregation protein